MFNIIAESKCIPKYKQLEKVPFVPVVVKGEEKSRDNYYYEVKYDIESTNTTDVGFNGEQHSKNASYPTNETYKLYFKNKDTADCNYDKCELMSKGCLWPYTSKGYLTMQDAFPWTLQAQTNIPEGYNATFCIKCSNAWDAISLDDIMFAQVEKPKGGATVTIIIVAVLTAIVMGTLGYCYGKKKSANNQVSTT